MNAYEMIESIRDSLGESVAKHWNEKNLLRKLNRKYQAIARLYLEADGDWFMTSTELTPDSNSQITLPSDCFKPSYLEVTSSHERVEINESVRESQLGKFPRSTLTLQNVMGFLIGDKIEINQDDYSEGLTLWYRKRIVDLHAGTLATSTADESLIFDASLWPSGEDDYYNGKTVVIRNNSTDAFVGSQEILDYAGATGIATIATLSPPPAANYYYGTESELTEEGDLVVLRETILEALAKPSSTTEEYIFRFWRDLVKQARKDLDEFLDKRIDTYTGVRRT